MELILLLLRIRDCWWDGRQWSGRWRRRGPSFSTYTSPSCAGWCRSLSRSLSRLLICSRHQCQRTLVTKRQTSPVSQQSGPFSPLPSASCVHTCSAAARRDNGKRASLPTRTRQSAVSGLLRTWLALRHVQRWCSFELIDVNDCGDCHCGEVKLAIRLSCYQA